ncbi:MAG: hypothetical protein NUV57_04855 [archaeon]|nr:hypothetical protein [archaeon]
MKKLKEKGLDNKNWPKQKLNLFILKKDLYPSKFIRVLNGFAT